MSVRKKSSPVWMVSSEKLKSIVETSDSVKDVLSTLGLCVGGASRLILKKRMEEEGLSYTSLASRGRSYATSRLSTRCRSGKKSIPLEEILVENSSYGRGHLKRRLIKEGILKNICCICGQDAKWNGVPIVMILDHINGINDDNRKENLRLVCPNCNSQLPTFAGRNNKIKFSEAFCNDCGIPIQGKGVTGMCLKCAGKSRRKVSRPSKEELLVEVSMLGYRGTGKKYGVSDNAIRKWLSC